MKELVQSLNLEVEILIALVTAHLSVFNLRLVDSSLAIARAQGLLNSVHREYYDEQISLLSVRHRNALSSMLCEIKLCARLVFSTNDELPALPPRSPAANLLVPKTYSSSGNLGSVSSELAMFWDLSMLLLTRGSKVKFRQFKSPSKEHWGIYALNKIHTSL